MLNKKLAQGRKNTDTAIQGFAPTEIQAITTGTVDTTNWLAFCFPNDDMDYKINAAGIAMTLPAGSVRVVDESVTSIEFTGTANCEVM
jgi:hypothetical protein